MSNVRVELTRNDDDTWQASVNGAVVPLADYTIEPAGDGLVLVSLTVAADTVSVGRSPAGAPAPAAQERPKLSSVWGSSGPDPRDGIAGWRPESLGGQVAERAARSATEIMPGVRPVMP